MPKDYLGMRVKNAVDKVDHGIKGMKWGVRRSDAQIAKGILKRKSAGEPVTPTKKAAEVTGSSGAKPAVTKSSSGEPDSVRYARLQSQAKAGKAKEMSEADLKFFNARTEALSKVAKLNEQQPGWLATTAKSVLQQTAKRQLQMASDAVADKYINEKLVNSLKKAEEVAEQKK